MRIINKNRKSIVAPIANNVQNLAEIGSADLENKAQKHKYDFESLKFIVIYLGNVVYFGAYYKRT